MREPYDFDAEERKERREGNERGERRRREEPAPRRAERPLEARLPRREPDEGLHRPPEEELGRRRSTRGDSGDPLSDYYSKSYNARPGGGKRVAPKRGDAASPVVAQHFGQEQRINEKQQAKREEKLRAQRRRLMMVITAAVLILALLIGGVVALWKTFAKKPDLPDAGNTASTSQGTERDPNAPTRLSGDRKEDFYTFLVIGRDSVGGGNTDTVLLAAYDVPNQKLNVMNLPRDTMMNVSWDVKKLNSIYNQYRDKDKAIAFLGEEVAQLIGFVPDFQVIVELDAVQQMVDAIGGVTFDVPCDMIQGTDDLYIELKAGEQLIDGHKAMQLLRFRGYPNADLDRIKTQQAFVKACLQKCLSFSTMTRIGELTKIFKENVSTNLELGNLAWFAEKAVMGGLKSENIFLTTMPCDTGVKVWSRQEKKKLDYVVPRTDEVVALINERFNPYKDPIAKDELDIMYVKEDGSVASTTGKLEDVDANKR